MKVGMVSSIRVNPHDCQCILAIMKASGLDPYDGKSWAQCVSMSLSALIGLAIKMKVIEEPDSFQYLNNMAPFLNSGNSRKKSAYADNLYRLSATEEYHGPEILPSVLRPTEQYVPTAIKQKVGGKVVLDEETYNLLFAEFQELDARFVELSVEEKERRTELNNVLFS